MIKRNTETIGITETKKNIKITRECRVDEGKRAKDGVGLIFVLNRLQEIIQQEYVNERIFTVKVNLVDEEIWAIIIAYGEKVRM